MNIFTYLKRKVSQGIKSSVAFNIKVFSLGEPFPSLFGPLDGFTTSIQGSFVVLKRSVLAYLSFVVAVFWRAMYSAKLRTSGSCLVGCWPLLGDKLLLA